MAGANIEFSFDLVVFWIPRIQNHYSLCNPSICLFIYISSFHKLPIIRVFFYMPSLSQYLEIFIILCRNTRILTANHIKSRNFCLTCSMFASLYGFSFETNVMIIVIYSSDDAFYYASFQASFTKQKIINSHLFCCWLEFVFIFVFLTLIILFKLSRKYLKSKAECLA